MFFCGEMHLLSNASYLETPPTSHVCKPVDLCGSANRDYRQQESIFCCDQATIIAKEFQNPGRDFSDDDEVEENCPANSKKRRIRLTVSERKFHVERYLEYKLDNHHVSCQIDIGDQLIRNFVEESNSVGIYLQMNASCLSRWIHAYERGEYDVWVRYKRENCKSTDRRAVVQQIDKKLKKRDMYSAVYNQVDWSPSLPKEYGVVARKFTPSGTFLGFYKGAVLTGENRDNRNYAYTFAIGRNLFIDTSAFLSCFARYYNCATDHTDQNVSVELLPNWENPQKAICFIANRDIVEGEEFLVSYGPEYWANFAEYLPRKSQLLKVCAKLSNETGYGLFTPRYSLEAPTLAANFMDDQSDSDDDAYTTNC